MKKIKLFMLHFAGGSCYSFQFLIPLLNDFDVITIELPGRGKRINEILLKDFDLAATDIYNQIFAKVSNESFIIYGHSMGAYLGLRVSNMLQKVGKSPAYLVVTGNAGPGIKSEKYIKRYLLQKDEFIEELKRLGGIPIEIINNIDMFNFFEPILRADFEIAEKNYLEQEPAVDTPIHVIMGDREEHVKQVLNWSRFTKAKFSYEIVEGGHFFIYKHPEKIVDVFKRCRNFANYTFI